MSSSGAITSKIPLMAALRSRLRRRRNSFWRAAGWMLDEADLLKKYGRLFPRKLPLGSSGLVVFVNPHERRGRYLLRVFGQDQIKSKQIWHCAVEYFRPSLVLDVGLNYGEFLFGERYPAGTRLIGIEANTDLGEYIEASRSAHPEGSQVEIHYCLASDTDSDEGTLYVDPIWSGRSTAMPAKGERSRPVHIPRRRVDSLLGDFNSGCERILFKVDVEGSEPSVLRGMSELLDRSKAAVGLVEFDANLFGRQSETDRASYIAYLFDRFEVYVVDSAQCVGPQRLTASGLDRQCCDHPRFHVDLLLLAGTDPAFRQRLEGCLLSTQGVAVH